MEITPMTLDHYEQSIELWMMTEGLVLSESDSKEHIGSFLRRNENFSYVCLAAGRVVGTSLCGHDGRRGFLYHVAVKRRIAVKASPSGWWKEASERFVRRV